MTISTLSPIENKNMNFITEPHLLLLEVKETFIADSFDISEIISPYASDLFIEPSLGVYRKNCPFPLFLANEKLYTHQDTFDFFPEIGSKFVSKMLNFDNVIEHLHVGQVGKTINWRQAVEENINVYNAKGQLIFRADDNRDGLVFNPGPDSFVNQFVLDLTKYFVYKDLPWSTVESTISYIKTYFKNTLNVEIHLESILGKLIHMPYFRSIREFINREPFSIYHIKNIGNAILVEAGCDYRHYKCNFILWDKEKNKEQEDHSDVYEVYNLPEIKNQGMSLDKLEKLFGILTVKTGLDINNSTDFCEAIEKLNKPATLEIAKVKADFYETINCFLRELKLSGTDSRNFVSQLTKETNGRHNGFNFNFPS